MPLRDWFFGAHAGLVGRRAIDDLVRSLALFGDPDALSASIAARVRDLVGCEEVLLCVLRPAEAAFIGLLKRRDSLVHRRICFAARGTLAGWLRVNDEPLLIPDPRGAFEYLDDEERACLVELDARVCVPMTSGPKMVGILILTASPKFDWNSRPEDMQLVSVVARQGGLALEHAQLLDAERQRLKNLHRADQLAIAGQLAATVAHEIRNPLSAIRSTIQYTVESAADWATKRPMLESLLHEVDRIEHTVSEVLALSRPHQPEYATLDFVDVVSESLLLIRAHAQAQGITLLKQIDADRLPIVGDRSGLHQVCLNLLLNACQAMPGGGRIVLRCAAAAEASRSYAVLQIQDSGCGIPADELPRVFDPFFTTKRAGTGLGLPICMDIVTRHEGQIRLDSQQGQGTSVTVLIPLRGEH